MKKTVMLIYGGEGYERDISIKSAENLSRLIDTDKYKLLYVEISKSGAWYLRGGINSRDTGATLTYPVLLGGASGILVNGVLIHIDAAVIALHGDHGEDGMIQGALAAAHIKYVGQDVYAAAATSDKAYTKLIAERLGIRTAGWLLAVSEDEKTARIRAEEKLGYPMFIKPARLGSSFGAHPVRSREDFDFAYLDAQKYGDGRVLIEELIDISYELECALFDDGVRIISPNGRILSDGRFYDYKSKY